MVLPRAGPAAQQGTSCPPGALIGAVHSAQEGNIGQPTRILPRRHRHCLLPKTPAAALRLLEGEEKRIAFVRGRKNNIKKDIIKTLRGQEEASEPRGTCGHRGWCLQPGRR